ncbi:Bipolar DNA helicase, partial [Vibrio harveyi]|nr:Bipolar DNA helicase [Vibrio harveyi]
MSNETSNAQVIGVFPDKVRISVDDIAEFTNGESIKVGSYIRITDNEDCVLIAAIENFSIESTDNGHPKYLIEAFPLGVIDDGKFIRGGDALTIPPTGVAPATEEDIRKVFEDSVEKNVNFSFSKLLSNQDITVPVNGNK